MSKLKEAYLISGKDIKTINGKPITGEGDFKINEVPASGVSSSQIANNAVTTSKIANKAVTEGKLADGVTERLLPTVTGSDAGKVATVDNNGDWTAITGGGYNYSTDEHVVGTWIDGKKIYEKTFITNGLEIPDKGSVTLPNNIYLYLSPILENLIGCTGMRLESENKHAFTVPMGCWYDLAETSIKVYSFVVVSALTHFTIQYTKTTDTAEE